MWWKYVWGPMGTKEKSSTGEKKIFSFKPDMWWTGGALKSKLSKNEREWVFWEHQKT